MEIYNFKDFQDAVARLSISPYAEAITTLSGLSPQIVSAASRLAASYASLRGTVQLLTTNEDNEIVDETSEARETIARSAIVSAWVSIGAAVGRMISLRRALTGEGVDKAVDLYPCNYSAEGAKNKAGVSYPVIIPTHGSEYKTGFRICIPYSWNNVNPLGSSRHLVPLNFSRSPSLFENLFPEDAAAGRAYSRKLRNSLSPVAPTIDGIPFHSCYAIVDATNGIAVTDVLFLYNSLAGEAIVLRGMRCPTSISMSIDDGNFNTGNYLTGEVGAFNPLTLSVGELAMDYGAWLTGTISHTSDSVESISFPSAGSEIVSFDPLDPREIFAQSYDAARAILTLLEAMGYDSGLSAEEKALLD